MHWEDKKTCVEWINMVWTIKIFGSLQILQFFDVRNSRQYRGCLL